MGQTILTAGFFVLLTVAVINAYIMIGDYDQAYYEDEALETATGLASTLMSEISTKKFDGNIGSDPNKYYETDKFDITPVLGPSGAESNLINPWPDQTPYKTITAYNDIDDYKGYERTASSTTMSGFQLTVRVYYVTKSSPNDSVYSRTTIKKVNVSVQHTQYIPNKITISKIFSY